MPLLASSGLMVCPESDPSRVVASLGYHSVTIYVYRPSTLQAKCPDHRYLSLALRYLHDMCAAAYLHNGYVVEERDKYICKF